MSAEENNKNNNNNTNQNLKIILLGDTGVGKTCLINAYFNRKFNSELESTCTPEFSQKTIKIQNKKYTIEIWDTAGQERYRSLSKVFIKGANIIIFVYDITNEKTFNELNFWINYVEEQLWDESIYGLAANKNDLFNEQKVEKERGEKLAKDIGALFYETSAKEDQKGFQQFIEKLIKKLIENKKELMKVGTKLDNKKIKKEKKPCSC